MGVKKHSDITNQTDLHIPKFHKSSHEQGGSDEINLTDIKTSESNTTKLLQPDGAGKTQWNSGLSTGAIESSSTINVGLSEGFYIGAPGTNGTWRIARNSPSGTNEFIIQRRESGAYVTKASWPSSVTGLEVQSYVDTTLKTTYANNVSHFAPNETGGYDVMYGSNAWGSPAIDSNVTMSGNYTDVDDDMFNAWKRSGSHITHSDTQVYSVRAMGFWSSTAAPTIEAFLWKFSIANNGMSAATFSQAFTCVGKVQINPTTNNRSFNVTGSVSSVNIPAGYGFFWTFKNSTTSSSIGTCNVSAKILVP